MVFAPKAFSDTRVSTANSVERAIIDTNNLKNVSVELLQTHLEVLPILSVSTCHLVARDQLVGLA